MADSDVYAWYPVYTMSRAEKTTSELLLKKGVECFLPVYKVLKQWSDRKKWIAEPLFKSYLFVYIQKKDFDLVLQCKGVVRFIYFSGEIAKIHDRDIQLLKDYLDGTLTPEIIFDQYEEGQRVKIISGKLKGYEAEMISLQQQQRLILRMDALGQSLLLNIAATEVIPLL